MKNILPLLLAAALGSAATYFIMDSKQASAPAAKAVKAAPRVAGGNTSAEQPAVAPGTDAQRKSPGGFTGGTKGKGNGFLPEEIPGVSAEQFTKCRTALMSTFRNETVRAAYTKVNEIRKELDGATVKIPGFIVPLDVGKDGLVAEFFLVPYFGACIHVPPPPPNQIVYVRMDKGIALDSIYEAYWITGKMKTNNKTTRLGAAAYQLAGTKIEIYKY